MRYEIIDPDGAVEVCPECDYTGFKKRKNRKPKYRCKACGETFKTPDTRPSRQGGKVAE